MIKFLWNKYKYKSALYTLLYFNISNDLRVKYNQVASKIRYGRSKIGHYKPFYNGFYKICLVVVARASDLP